MKNRFVRIGSFALMLVMLLGCCSFTAYAAGYSSSGNSFTLLNMSGIAITEVYFYPSYNSSWGKIRNTSWIYNGREAKVSLLAYLFGTGSGALPQRPTKGLSGRPLETFGPKG